MELENQIAVITGSGQGIGRACALKLAEAGADIVSADINGEKATETAKAVEALGRRALVITADLGDVAEINRMIEETAAHLGRIA